MVSAQTGSGKTVAYGLAMAGTLMGDTDRLPNAGAPLALVVFGGALNAVYLIGVAISTVYLSRHQPHPLVKGGSFMTVMMWISAFAICVVGGVGLYNALF